MPDILKSFRLMHFMQETTLILKLFVKCNWIICLTEDLNTARCLVSVLFTIFRTAAWHQTSSTIHQPVANWPISVLTTLILLTQRKMKSIEYFHSRGQHMQIYWNKRKRLHKKRVQLPEDWFGKHGHRFIVLGHQYGRRDVMWKHSIC